jgi:hypothetical protein
MLRYFYAWTPLVIVATIVLLSLPWLGLIALMVATLAILLALAGTLVYAPYMLVQAISRRWQVRRAGPRPAAVLSPATPRPAFRKGYVA